MKNIMNQFAVTGIVLLSVSSPAYAEPQLYETGPSEESSYVRFVNVTEGDVAIAAAKGKEKMLSAQADGRVSRFFKIKTGAKLSATIKSTSGSAAVEVVGKPWEFITVAVIQQDAKHLKIMQIKETPTEFSGSRASLALLNLDEKCSSAVLPAHDKDAAITYEVKPFSLQRHLINSDKQPAVIKCKDDAVAVDLSHLEPGERYSAFMFSLKSVRQTFIVRDDKK